MNFSGTADEERAIMKEIEEIAKEIYEFFTFIPDSYEGEQYIVKNIADWHIKQLAKARKETAEDIMKVLDSTSGLALIKCQEIIKQDEDELK